MAESGWTGRAEKKRSLSTPNCMNVMSGTAHFSVIRNAATAPAAAGLAGATMGSPVRRTFSTSTGHNVTGAVVR